MRESLRYAWKVPFCDSFKQALHVISCERRFQGNHLIEDASEGPYIALHIVWLVSPDLWTSIIRCTSLSIIKSSLISHFRHIHVAQFRCEILIQEDIGAFQVSVHDV